MTIPSFFSEDGAAIIAEVKAITEMELGRTIAPADPEMLLVNAWAYRELLRNKQANVTVSQNLVAFANGIMLDELCAQVGVRRLPATGAQCTFQISLVAGNTGVVLPAGIRIQSTDQQVIFTTDAQVIVAEGETSKTVTGTAQTTGSIGNNYAIGKISVVMDPQPFVSAITNTDSTAGGADDETDEQLRQRYPLALSSFSVAGPKQAYIYWAKTAHQSIIDVAVTNPTPGHVNIYPLCTGGTLPSDEIIAEVLAICSADKVRPLCDIVSVLVPTSHDYSIAASLVLYDNADQTKTQALINSALTALVAASKNKLGKDVVKSQLAAACMLEGVYSATITTPSADYVAADNVYTNCTGITLTITGTANG